MAQQAYSRPMGARKFTTKAKITISAICSRSCSLAVLITWRTAKKYPRKQADTAMNGRLGARIFRDKMVRGSFNT